MEQTTDPQTDPSMEAAVDDDADLSKNKRKQAAESASPTAPPSSPLKPLRKRSCAGVASSAIASALGATASPTQPGDSNDADTTEARAEAVVVHTADTTNASGELLVVKSHPEAELPTKSSEGSVGYDLCWCSFAQNWEQDAPEVLPDCAGIATIPRALVKPGKTAVMATGLIMAPPPGCYLRIAPRSGLSVMGISVGAGVIDPDYRGKVGVVLHNLSNDCMVFEHGERIAQVVVERCCLPKVVELTKENTPDAYEAFVTATTERDVKGFGSSGRF